MISWTVQLPWTLLPQALEGSLSSQNRPRPLSYVFHCPQALSRYKLTVGVNPPNSVELADWVFCFEGICNSADAGRVLWPPSSTEKQFMKCPWRSVSSLDQEELNLLVLPEWIWQPTKITSTSTHRPPSTTSPSPCPTIYYTSTKTLQLFTSPGFIIVCVKGTEGLGSAVSCSYALTQPACSPLDQLPSPPYPWSLGKPTLLLQDTSRSLPFWKYPPGPPHILWRI